MSEKIIKVSASRKLLATNIHLLAWLLSSLVASLAIIAWGQGVNWHFSGLSIYQIFPVFGLLAFSLIWSMYSISFTARQLKIEAAKLKKYFQLMSVAVFSAILIHPGLIWWQLWRDGFGLPPESYLQHYLAPSLKWAVLLGSTAWLVFVAYEFRYKFRSRCWWKYIECLADVGLVAIFFHALALGGQLRPGQWFRWIWYFYGLALALFLIDLYINKYQKYKQSRVSSKQKRAF